MTMTTWLWMGWKTFRCYKFRGYSITYRIATGKQQGRKVFTLQIIAPIAEQGLAWGCASNVASFSLHAGVMSNAQDRGKLERLCRCLLWRESRSGVSEKRLAITTCPQGLDIGKCLMHIHWWSKKHLVTWIQKMTKSSNYCPPQSRAPPQISLFE